MDVRRFEAFSMSDAIKLVKKELGKDAVILSTREKESFSIEGGRPLKLIEVVATSASQMTANKSDVAQPVQRPSPTLSSTGTLRRAAVLTQAEAKFAKSVNFPHVDDVRRSSQEPTIVRGSSTFAGFPPAAPLPLTNRAENDKSWSREKLHEAIDSSGLAEIQHEVSKIRKEIEALPQLNVGEQMQEIKVLLHDLMRNKAENCQTSQHEYVNDIGVRLRAAGVLEAIIVETLQEIVASSAPAAIDGSPIAGQKLKEWYLSVAIRSLFRKIAVTGPWKAELNKQQIICLVGPTGVGKTTTIAKLAARFKLSEGKKVALATMDTFRIGGSEQLKVYAQILNCPFQEINEPLDLESFVDRFYDCDVLLIDTAGVSSRAADSLQVLRKMESLPIPIVKHLVLSSSMKQRDLEETIKRYKQIGIKSLIFTKLDESWSYGEILNCACLSKVPLSYFATGQKVPEDLESASKERIIERIFRL